MDEMERSLTQVEDQLVQAIDRKIEGLEQEVVDLNMIIHNTKNAWTLIEVKLKKEKLTALAALARSKMLLAEMEVLIAESELNDLAANPSKKYKSSPEQTSPSETGNTRVQSNQRKPHVSTLGKSAASSRSMRRKRAASSSSHTKSKSHISNDSENNEDTSIIRRILSETTNLCMNNQRNTMSENHVNISTATPSSSLQNSRVNSIWRKAFSDPVSTSIKKTNLFKNVELNTVSEMLQNPNSDSDWRKAFSNSVSSWVENTNLHTNENRNTMSKNPVNTVSVVQQKRNSSTDSDSKISPNNSNSSLVEKSNLYMNKVEKSKSQSPVDTALPARLGSLQNSSSDSDWNKSLTSSILDRLDEIEKAGISTLTKEQPKTSQNIKINPMSNITAFKKTQNKKDNESHILCTPSGSKKPPLHPGDPRKSYFATNTQPKRTPTMLSLPQLMTSKRDF